MTEIFDFFRRKNMIKSVTFNKQLWEIRDGLMDAQKRIYGKLLFLKTEKGLLCFGLAVWLSIIGTKTTINHFGFDLEKWKQVLFSFSLFICVFLLFSYLIGIVLKKKDAEYQAFRDAYINQVAYRAYSNSIRGDDDILMLKMLISSWMRIWKL